MSIEKPYSSNEEGSNKEEFSNMKTAEGEIKPQYTMENGYVTSFGEMSDEEIIEQFILKEPEGFKGTLGRGAGTYEIGDRWKRLLNEGQQRKRARLKEETGKELTRSERLKKIWGGIGKIIKSPIYTIAGGLTVLGTAHGVAHTASQGTVGFKQIISGVTGKYFDENDNSKWYNRVANKGV